MSLFNTEGDGRILFKGSWLTDGKMMVFFKESMVRNNNNLKKDEFQINHWYVCDLSETYEQATTLNTEVPE